MIERCGRREAAKRFLTVLGVVGVAPAALVGCGEGEPEGGPLTCTDTAGLSAQAVRARQLQRYVDRSEVEGQTCANCSFYQLPHQEGRCGTCPVLERSPVHPAGYCALWAATG